jgi:prepilin-type N-terminal cleavage/methylation domain-containing protein
MKEDSLMKKRKSCEKGFTLIEVIVTLVLVGITAALAGMWIVSVANGYVFAKTNAKTAQNGQLAMTRLVKEFNGMKSVTSAGSTSITFKRADSPTTSVDVNISLNTLDSTLLQINNNTLTDKVSAFSLTYCTNPTGTAYCGGEETANSCSSSWSSTTSRTIRIDLTLTAGNSTPVTFTRCVTPRNL